MDVSSPSTLGRRRLIHDVAQRRSRHKGSQGDRSRGEEFGAKDVQMTYPDDAGGDRGYVEFSYDAALRMLSKVDQEA